MFYKIFNFFNSSNGNNTNATKTSGQTWAFVTTNHILDTITLLFWHCAFITTWTKHSGYSSICQVQDQFSYNGVEFYFFLISSISINLHE